jgi:hypothetical protein
MPQDNPDAYRKIDEFVAGLSPDEVKYAYGAIEAMMGDESEDESMPEDTMDESPMPAEDKTESDMVDFDELEK